ncbi:ferredoxin--NADP reductase [Nitrososphaera viennensis]|mgnify:CR=1 FL=1|uniref:ferredoxin--NADP(+) reductase n=2 Tax=Nitrososphaera viennensis TaxID=1034015 RepID=A0A060HS70_9ARCH|nr:ferredoxin--NADP reductase [Nitrososphaera viennensis]AIC16002.1 putative FAD/NAD(P)-binding oxidoreductase [Nitrososphaera viennensis EN76]UVS67977.1 ferredoxin--NADP reductase [Nitrososphaera viennensis]
MSAQPNLGKLVYRKDLTPDLAIIRIQPSDGSPVPDFKPGQFVTLGLKLDGEGDKITNRAYSLSSPPEEKRYFELYIKWAQEPVPGKFTTALFNMKEGDELYWRKPAGAFTIEDKRVDGTPDERTLVLVASGTGLAPFVGYALHLKATGSRRRIALLHGARNAKELGYRDLFERLAKESNGNFVYLPTVSRPNDPGSEGWTGHTGRVESLLVPKDSNGNGGGDRLSELERALGGKVTPENSFFHICGYSGTIDSVISILQPLGFVSNRHKRKDGSFDIKVETYG